MPRDWLRMMGVTKIWSSFYLILFYLISSSQTGSHTHIPSCAAICAMTPTEEVVIHLMNLVASAGFLFLVASREVTLLYSSRFNHVPVHTSSVTFWPDFVYYTDTLDCLFSLLFSSPHQSPCTIWSVDLNVVQYNLMFAMPVSLYDMILCLRCCTISISEPPLLQYSVLGELQSLST